MTATQRRNAITVGCIVAALVVTQFLLPGAGSGRGTPIAILFSGLVTGLVTAMTTIGIILVYRTTRIINFAQTAIGALGATLCLEFVQYTPLPFPIAFALGLALAGGTGALFDLGFGRRFAKAPRLVLTVLTIAVIPLIVDFAARIRELPFFPTAAERGIDDLKPEVFEAQLPLRGLQFNIGDFALPFGFPEIFAIDVAVLALVGIFLFFRFTRSGVAVRAMAENAERAGLLGISVGSLSTIVWTLAGVVSCAGITMTGVISGPQATTGFAPELLLPALAAAVVARMDSIPAGAAVAVAISMARAAILFSFSEAEPLLDVGLLLVVGVGLLVQRRRRTRSEAGDGGSWQATEEQHPVPREMLAITGIRIARYAFLGILLVAIGIFPFVASIGLTNLGGVIALTTIVALSLVVLTGWAGQVSLGQFGFVAVGAVVGGTLTSRVGIPFWFAVPLAAALTGAFAVLVGLPALRIKGLFLGVTTFAFAVAVPSALFSEKYFGWLLPDAVERPKLFLLDFDDERSMFFLCVACLVVSCVVVANLRKSRWGRLLIGLRENENVILTAGVSVVRTKLMAFALSGALAGFAGAVFAHQQRGVSLGSFSAQASVDVFLLAVIGGVSSVPGAILGSAYFNLTRYFFQDGIAALAFGPFFTVAILYAAPGGLISLVTRVRDEVLRIVAQRRHMIVPSLFADYDPAALERRLAPLSEPLTTTGLAALGGHVDFALTSELYPDELGEVAPPPNGRSDARPVTTSERIPVEAGG